MQSSEQAQENPEAKAPLAGAGSVLEPSDNGPTYCLEFRKLIDSGSIPSPFMSEGSYRGYPLHRRETIYLMDWLCRLFHHQAERDPLAFPYDLETVPDGDDGLAALFTTSRETGNRFLLHCRPLVVPCTPMGLYVFWGDVLNPATQKAKEVSSLAEYISTPLAQGKPVTKAEASAELDRLCEQYNQEGVLYSRFFGMRTREDAFTPVDLPELADGEAVAAGMSAENVVIVGYWLAVPENRKEG